MTDIKQQIQNQLFDQVRGVIETGSNGEIKVYRNKDEADAARERMVSETRRRLETDPNVLELVRLEIEFQTELAKEKAAAEKAAAAREAEGAEQAK